MDQVIQIKLIVDQFFPVNQLDLYLVDNFENDLTITSTKKVKKTFNSQLHITCDVNSDVILDWVIKTLARVDFTFDYNFNNGYTFTHISA